MFNKLKRRWQVTFEDFIHEKIDVKDVEFIEKYMETMDIQDWLNYGTAYALREKEELINRLKLEGLK